MTYKEHIKENLKIGVPVMISQLGIISVNFFDTLMIGNIDDATKGIDFPSIALGGVSLGNAIFFMILVFSMGISMSISPLVSEAYAKLNYEKIKKVFSNGMILNILVAIFMFVLLLPFYSLFEHFVKNKEIVEVMKSYLFINMISIFPVMIFQTYKQLSEGMRLTKLVTYSVISSNIINIILNYLLINGNFGFPKLGVDGAAIATLIARICATFLLFYLLTKNILTKNLVRFAKNKFDKDLIKKMLSLGLPIAFQMGFEISAFSLAAFICEQYGAKDLAAHHITLQVVTMTFLLCTGLSVASTVQVAKFKSLEDDVNVRKSGFSNLFLVICFMFFSGLCFVVFNDKIPLIFTNDVEVIKISSMLFIVAALFQLSDGIQVVAIGSLRGLQEVKIPTIITFFAYWLIAIPLGWYFTINCQLGALGVWIALGLGLLFSALLLTYMFNKITKLDY
jgi:MATE family multidrug resistance protein